MQPKVSDGLGKNWPDLNKDNGSGKRQRVAEGKKIYILSCVCRLQENHLRNQKGEANGRQLFELVSIGPLTCYPEVVGLDLMWDFFGFGTG